MTTIIVHDEVAALEAERDLLRALLAKARQHQKPYEEMTTDARCRDGGAALVPLKRSMVSTDNISQYLFDALITSDAEEFSFLKMEVEEYRQTHHQSWFAATKHPFLGKLLDAIEEAVKFRAETEKEDDDASIKEHNP